MNRRRIIAGLLGLGVVLGLAYVAALRVLSETLPEQIPKTALIDPH